MAKTIEQLAIQANEIQQATIQGENTALRVGGLFSDMVDYLATFHASDVVLGPLLTALNNVTGTPGEGMTLTFVGDGWDYSSAITQIRISQNGIEQLVASNYRAFVNANEQITNYINGVENQVLQNRADYDETQVEFYTWKGQTDRSISSVAAAVTVDGEIVSMSYIIQRCDNIQTAVTNNWNAFVKEETKLENNIFGYTDDHGVFHNGLSQRMQGAEDDIDGIDSSIGSINGRINTLDDTVGTFTWVNQSKDSIVLAAGAFGDNAGTPYLKYTSGLITEANMVGMFNSVTDPQGRTIKEAYFSLYVTKDNDNYITNALLKADNITFNYSFNWVAKVDGNTTFSLDNKGNMKVGGDIELGVANTSGGLRLTSTGGIQRYSSIQGAWIPLYAARNVRYASAQRVELTGEDDFVFSGVTNTEILLPSENKYVGRIITIKSVGGEVRIIASSGSYIVTDNVDQPITNVYLHGYDRCEFLFHGARWYWNAYGI